MAAVLESSPLATSALNTGAADSVAAASAPALRIGIMLRHWEQHGGVTVYAQQITRALLDLNSAHTFVLFYRNPALKGMFRDVPNVEEVVLRSPYLLYWDQVSIRRAVTKHRIDVLFNPKYSVPLGVSCPTAWVCHGLDWYVMPQASPWLDRLSHRFLVPRYAAKADAIISVSKLTSEHLTHYLNVPSGRVHTIYPGIGPQFSKTIDAKELHAARQKYRLPPRYVVYSGAVYPPKNFTRMVQAYARVGPRLGVSLVIAGGENRYLSQNELREPERLHIEHWVRRLGWVDNESLPAIYSMAEALLLPSTFEAVGFPVLEAMAVGCAVLTSNRWGTKEIADGAAELIDPDSVEAISAGLERLLCDEPHRAELILAGKRRAQQFQWTATARDVLRVLETIYCDRSPVGHV